MHPELRRRGARIRFADDGRTLRYIPLADLNLQTELRVETEQNIGAFKCPCKDCYGGLRKSIHIIRAHLQSVDRDLFLRTSMIGADPLDGYPPHSIWVEDIPYNNDDVVDVDLGDVNNDDVPDFLPNVQGDEPCGGAETPLDEYHDVQRQVQEALERRDSLHREVGTEPNMPLQDDMDNDIVQGLEELYHQATTPLYRGSKTSIVSATIVILNMYVGFGVSNNFTSELLHYLSEDLLSEVNKLPSSHYAAAKTIRKLGLDYNIIHACPNGCVLYEGDHALLETCLHCSKSRWMEGSNSIPAKVIRHFPLISRLKRMWRSPELATMLTGYTKHVSNDSIM